MISTSLTYSASKNGDLITLIANLANENTKEHFVIIRGNGKLNSFDSASKFVDYALHLFDIGYTSTSMSLDGETYDFHEEAMETILRSLLWWVI